MNFAQNEQFTAKKASGLGVVILVHALLATGLIYGLHSTVVHREVDPPPVTIDRPTIKPEPTLTEASPQAPTHPSVYIPFPELPVIPSTTSPIAETTGTKPTGPVVATVPGTSDGPPTVAVPPHIAMQQSVIVDPDSCKPSYPIPSLQAGDEGTVRVRFEIGADSRIAASSIVKSSGFPALDKAALNGLGKCSFKAATQDGAPVKSTLMMDYVWSIN